MTDLTVPAESGGSIRSTAAGHAWAKAGTGGWIVDGADIASAYSVIDTDELNGFAYNTSAGLEVTIDPGEAYLAGWLCRDRQTDVMLPESGETTVYIGYDSSAVLGEDQSDVDSENVIVGLESEFDSNDPQLPIWTFQTDQTNVLADPDDHRLLQKPLQYDPVTEELVSISDLSVPGLSVAQQATVYGGIDSRGPVASTVESLAGEAFRAEDAVNGTRMGWRYTGSGELDFVPDPGTGYRWGSALSYNFDTGQWIFRSDTSVKFEGDVDAGSGPINDVNDGGHNAVSSPDATKIYVSSSEPDDNDPHLWFIPED